MRRLKKLESISDIKIAILYFLALSIMWVFLFGGCSQLPPKPKGTVWIVDYPRMEIVGAPFGEFHLDFTRHRQVKMQFGTWDRGKREFVERRPLSEANKYICFDPDSWDRLDAWIKEVQKIAEKKFEQ